MPAQPLVDAKQAALAHYGRLVVLAEDAAAGRRARRIHSSLAGVGLSDRAVRLYLYEGHEAPTHIVPAFNGVPTEVVPTTGFRPAQPARHRPASGGASVGLAYVNGAGTFGCLVEDPAGDRYLLSNNHVLADINRAPIGSPIIQPAKFDGGVTPRDDIARLAAFEPIDFAGPNRVDAALGALTDPAIAAPGALTLGPFADPPVPGAVGQRVRKHGRTTAHTRGIVVDASFDGFVDYGPAGVAWFEDQIVVEGEGDAFAAAGDSGALIVDEGNHPLALLFAGDDRRTLANPIAVVLSALGMTVA